jgi:hypothetical protein
MDFYLLLYCLWYKINDDTAINEYYQGIQEVFNITNKYSSNIYNICLTHSTDSNITFEEIIIKMNTPDFIDFKYNRARPFCYNDEHETKYPDCGETTMRNLINLICFKDGIFDVDTLRQYHAISGLIEYYTIFNNFAKQSSNTTEKIYGLDLNARDAWSHLIIHKANDNLTFNQHCFVNRNNYNLKASSKTADGKSINSFQLLKNLLPEVEDWDYLNKYNDNIESIAPDLNKNGVGIIEIYHKIFGKIRIQYTDGHAFWHKIENLNQTNMVHLDINKQTMVNILNKTQEITEFNYLFFKYNENIIELLKVNSFENFKLYDKILKVSLTNIIDSEIRQQIQINTNKEEIMLLFKQYNWKEMINDYIYVCTNFNFISEYIPQLKNIHSLIIDRDIVTIDLSPLCNIISIGNNFLDGCSNLIKIDLSPLSNVVSLGQAFLADCSSLEEINLKPLSKVKIIKNGFLDSCSSLNIIDLTPLSNITSINSYFLSNCSGLININLTALTRVISIDSYFISNCNRLTEINLSSLAKVKKIGNNFLYNCNSLTEINLSSLSNVEKIGNSFLWNCNSLTEIFLLLALSHILNKKM